MVGGRDAELEGLLKFIHYHHTFRTFRLTRIGKGEGEHAVEPTLRTGSERVVRGEGTDDVGSPGCARQLRTKRHPDRMPLGPRRRRASEETRRRRGGPPDASPAGSAASGLRVAGSGPVPHLNPARAAGARKIAGVNIEVPNSEILEYVDVEEISPT